uniref:CD81 molecule n=1 Tax=Moschus moschiferus TaxID=68415 RepID=A0A8C6FSV6_MOSMO
MGVEGCTKCIKYLLFVFNFVFWLAGGVILGVALWLRHDPQTTNLLYLELGDRPAPNTFYVGIYILIAVGAVMMFVGFLGCYGAIQESQCLLGTFFTCLVILFACEVAAGIWGFVNKDQIAKDVKQFYDQALQQAIVDDDANNAKAVVKTFHETVRRGRGLGHQGSGPGQTFCPLGATSARSGRGTGAGQPPSQGPGLFGGSPAGTRWASAAEWKGGEEWAPWRGSAPGGDCPKPPAPGPGWLPGPLQPAGHVPRADGGRCPSLQLNCCGSNTLITLTTSVLKNSLCPSGGNVITNLFKVCGDSRLAAAPWWVLGGGRGSLRPRLCRAVWWLESGLWASPGL